MRRSFRLTLSVVLVFALTLLFGVAAVAAAADVAVFNSALTQKWYSEVGWDYAADMDAVKEILDVAGVSYAEITNADLVQGNLGDAKLLIMPNTRRMSAAEVEAAKKFLADGGAIFALGQTSFRDENNKQVSPKHFQLADEFGIAYESFAWQPPAHAYIHVVEASHPIFNGLPEFVKFPRNWAMVVSLNGGTQLAEWFNDDQMTPSHLPEINSAIVEGPSGRTIYIGDMIFMQDALDSPEIRTLLQNVITYLLSKVSR